MESFSTTAGGTRGGVESPASQMRRRSQYDFWESQWSNPGFNAPWMNRGISREIIAAVEDGWFSSGAPALDIGCGQGMVAAWLAQRGLPTIGFDISPSAVAKAREVYGNVNGRLEFMAFDVCAVAPPDRQYGVLIDRGCLHQIPLADGRSYASNLHKVSAPGAKLLLFAKAFRDGIPFGDPVEQRRVTDMITAPLSSGFDLNRSATTYMDDFDGKQPDRALPGMVFWFTRRM